jgi:hypothetical protein
MGSSGIYREQTMKPERRDFLKLMGIGSAFVKGASGKELVKLNEPVEPVLTSGNSASWIQCMDVVSSVLYDKLVIESGGLETFHRFFNRGWEHKRGPEDTNVYNMGHLEAPEIFSVNKIGVTFSPGTSSEVMNALLRNYTLSFGLGNKYYFRAPLVEAFGFPNSDPTVDFKTLFTLDIPIIFSHEDRFFMEIMGTPPVLWSDVCMWGVLHGRMARGIQ